MTASTLLFSTAETVLGCSVQMAGRFGGVSMSIGCRWPRVIKLRHSLLSSPTSCKTFTEVQRHSTAVTKKKKIRQNRNKKGKESRKKQLTGILFRQCCAVSCGQMDQPAVHSHRSRRSSPLHPLELDDVQWHSHQHPLAVLILLLDPPVHCRKQTVINYEAWHTQ